jgi:Zn-dependent protease with chaperone function
LHARSESAERDRHHRLILSLQIALALAGLVAVGAAIAGAAGSVHRAGTSAHSVSVLGASFAYPAVNVAAALLLLLAAAGLAVLTTGVVGAMRLRRSTRRFVEHLPVVGSLPGHPDVTVIRGDLPQAFCVGYLRPRIVISAGAVAALSPAELEAVLQHERRHLEARDPLRLACARVLGRALFFIPALNPLTERSAGLSELRADDAAITAARGDRSALASAMLAFEARAPSGTSGMTPQRVDSLLGEPVDWRLPDALIAVSVALLTALIVLLWRASAVASTHATLDLPLVSAQPCMLVLALVPLVTFVALMAARRTH